MTAVPMSGRLWQLAANSPIEKGQLSPGWANDNLGCRGRVDGVNSSSSSTTPGPHQRCRLMTIFMTGNNMLVAYRSVETLDFTRWF